MKSTFALSVLCLMCVQYEITVQATSGLQDWGFNSDAAEYSFVWNVTACRLVNSCIVSEGCSASIRSAEAADDK